jgi:hypothetical protein
MLMSLSRIRKLRWWLAALAVAAAVATAGVVAPTASAVWPPDDGGLVRSCGNSGTTPVWVEVAHHYTQACLSNQTAFYAYKPDASGACQFFGYEAQVWHVDQSGNYHQRFASYWCEDGLWHWSSAWGYSENRFSAMRTYGAGVDWAMAQYRNP